ncbi:MAG: hypothetical protein O3C43_24580 [Verrucomicrobia bacterium]|nr:hypothetical protein [Verrucomicrobiota bacterium]MDA1069665.1 hypothetical protein [Verrucomicrobiota bacterium]
MESPDKDIEDAGILSKRSIEIDPYGEGYFFLGIYYAKVGNNQAAIEALLHFLSFDPTKYYAYEKLGELYLLENQFNTAREIVSRGIVYFEENLDDFAPRLRDDVWGPYNVKAIETDLYYQNSLRILKKFREERLLTENKPN